MKLFDDEGHLNNTSFLLLQNDGGEDLQRLEIAEHLSYCDDCLSRYLENISQMELLSPLPSMAANIQQKGKQLGAALFYRRFTVVAATFLAIVLWTTGAFSWQYRLIERNSMERAANRGFFVESNLMIEGTNQLSTMITGKFSGIVNQLQNWGSHEKKSNQKFEE